MKPNDKQKRQALILVDLQNDFVEGGSLAVPGGNEVIAIANDLMPRFDLVVATQDWHPRDHRSFASQNAGMAIGQLFELNGLPQIAWPDHCVQGTRGAEFVSALDHSSIHEVVQKGMDPGIDSYSGFFDNGHRKSTGLADLLRKHKITSVAVMGLATDYCVRFTALDAIDQGFETSLIVDACRGVELQPGDIDKAIQQMKDAGVYLTTSEQRFPSLLEQWETEAR